MAPRLILDTHVWLDWLVFDDPEVAPIREAAAANRLELYIDAACEAELIEVLGRGFSKKKLTEKERSACVAQCRRLAHRIDAAASDAQRRQLPVCRDPKDQKFLEAALVPNAQFLITKDRALLVLERRSLPFRIMTPRTFGGLPK